MYNAELKNKLINKINKGKSIKNLSYKYCIPKSTLYLWKKNYVNNLYSKKGKESSIRIIHDNYIFSITLYNQSIKIVLKSFHKSRL